MRDNVQLSGPACWKTKKCKSKVRAESDGEDADLLESGRRLILALVGLGLPRRACNIMVGSSPAEPTTEMFAEIQAKHPRADRLLGWDSLRRVHSSAAPAVDEETLCKAVKSFPKDSGCGLSVLRPQHILDAMVLPLRTIFIDNLQHW